MTRPGLLLGELLAAAGLGQAELLLRPAPAVALADGGPAVSDVVLAAAEVTPGALFACIKGANVDGHDFAREAMRRGASVLLCEHQVDVALPQVIVPSVRGAIGQLSAAFWSFPSQALKVIGVTGTNGKTTTCALLAAICEAEGWPAAVIGTLTGERTTPEAPTLQRRLATLRDVGAQAVAMEVSSHALEQSRTTGTAFAAAVFTNLSQDHLDYHSTMDRYFEAKARLFTKGSVALAVVNRGDAWGERLVARLSGSDVRLVMFAPEDAGSIELTARGARFSWRGRRLELNMGGRFNVTNALAAATTAVELGAGLGAVAEGLRSAAPVRGRFEAVDEGQDFAVLVDFAHTPTALAEALSAARELAVTRSLGRQGRVILVFGAGGDRDRTKRPVMGKVASELADVMIVTSDNPRTERPLDIIDQVVKGAHREPVVEADREKAISTAVSMASKGDVVLIAGKGHETGQDFGTHVEAFDDVEVARRALRVSR